MTFFGTEKQDGETKTNEMFNFMHLIKKSFTIA